MSGGMGRAKEIENRFEKWLEIRRGNLPSE